MWWRPALRFFEWRTWSPDMSAEIGAPRAGIGLACSLVMDDRHTRLDALEARTCRFAVGVLAFLDDTPLPAVLRRVAFQLSDAATSVSANHRAVRRSRSTKEFAAKLQVVNEEIDEAVHWLELLQATGKVPASGLAPLLGEARELRAIFAKARRTLKMRP